MNRQSSNKKNTAPPPAPPPASKHMYNNHQSHFEVTLNIGKDSVALHSIKSISDIEAANHSPIQIHSQIQKSFSGNAINEFKLSVNHASAIRALQSASARSNGSSNNAIKLTKSKSGAEHALKGLRFISRNNDRGQNSWDRIALRFDKLADDDGFMDRTDFGLCIGMEDSNEFAAELFDALARRKGMKLQMISKSDMHDFWMEISDQSFDARMQIFFDMCDKNLDGRISEEEVKEVIMLSASANKLSKLKEQAEEYAALIMEELDPDDLGYIELWQLETLMRGPTAARECSQTLSALGSSKKTSLLRPIAKSAKTIVENWKRVWVLVFWLGAVAGLFAWKFLQYKHKAAFEVMGYCVCTAKGAAETLKLNMALILFPVCRNTITWLRSTWLGSIVPFNDDINFHKTIALGIIVGVLVHAGCHLACDFPRIVSYPTEQFILKIGKGWHYQKPSYIGIIGSVTGITGIVMVILMVISFTLASRWFRRNLIKLPWPLNKMTGYNAFWYSHHLLVLVYILLVVHSLFLFLTYEWQQKDTWMYIAVPLLLYAMERTYRAFRAECGNYTVQTVKAAIYSGNVLAIHMTKPQGFKYKSGMYIFLKCPSISPFEWHPFSITSAPGDDHLSVHIRTSGDWTLKMKKLFSEVCAPSTGNQSGLLRADQTTVDNMVTVFPKLMIDGPYGAPAQDYKNYDVLLLIGLGIGATPFISILKDMLNHAKMVEQQPENFFDESPRKFLPAESPRKLLPAESPRRRKRRCPTNAYFYWVTREQGSFDWFKGVMNEVAEIDHKAMIEMHNYLTSVYEEGDARSALITMVQNLHHAKNGVDIVSGTRVRTHFARPNWKKVFSKLASTHRHSTVGVFYCGPAALAKELGAMSQEFTQQTSCRFEFHKENF